MCQPLEEFPLPTFVSRIKTPFFEFDRSYADCIFFDDEEPCNVEHWLKGGDNCWPGNTSDSAFGLDKKKVGKTVYKAKEQEWKARRKEIAAIVDCTTKCIELCAKYLASTLGHSSGHELPSAEYILQDLPRYFHSHFSPEMFATKTMDRATTVEWEYRAAPSVALWWSHMLGFDDRKEVDLETLPWYAYQHGDGQDDTDSSVNEEDEPLLDDNGAGRRVRRRLNEE